MTILGKKGLLLAASTALLAGCGPAYPVASPGYSGTTYVEPTYTTTTYAAPTYVESTYVEPAVAYPVVPATGYSTVTVYGDPIVPPPRGGAWGPAHPHHSRSPQMERAARRDRMVREAAKAQVRHEQEKIRFSQEAAKAQVRHEQEKIRFSQEAAKAQMRQNAAAAQRAAQAQQRVQAAQRRAAESQARAQREAARAAARHLNRR